MGRFLADDGENWWHHDEPEDCLKCLPGRIASRPGSASCEECPNGTIVADERSIACAFIEPGQYAKDAASKPKTCLAGTFAVGGSSKCEPCAVGTVQPKAGQASCKVNFVSLTKATIAPQACPFPMTTTGLGKTFCDACIASYFWNSQRFQSESESQCVDCCMRCEDVCDTQNDCVLCDEDGALLESLHVKEGRWRASSTALTVYECTFERSCRGGPSIADNCYSGHYGALCGACTKGYDFDNSRNRCAKCATTTEMLGRAANFIPLLIFFGLLVCVLYLRFKEQLRRVVLSVFLVVNDGVDALADHHKTQKDFRKSLLTKAKVVIAVWQIAASTVTVLFRVRFPPIFARSMKLFQVLGLTIFEVSSLNCIFGWTYFEKMLFVTLAPFAVIGLFAACYACLQRCKGQRQVSSKIAFYVLLFLYLILPSISTFIIGHFSCSTFADDGDKHTLRVVSSDLSIKCTSKRYKTWSVYAAIMIGIWPLGVPFIFTLLLWRNRRKLNPRLDKVAATATTKEGLQLRSERRYATAVSQLEKLEIRNKDTSLKSLEFIYEEFEPRCYLFPVFEIGRRIFLTSALTVFFPGSTRQTGIGVLGAMISCVVYYYYEPYIEGDDNVVSAVAQGELVLIYFAALMILTSQETDEANLAGARMGIVLLLISFASFLVAAAVVLLDVLGHSFLVESYDHVSKEFKKSLSSSGSKREVELTGPTYSSVSVQAAGLV